MYTKIIRITSVLLLSLLLSVTNLIAQQEKIPAQWMATFCPKSGDCGSEHHVMIAKDGSLLTWGPGEDAETLSFPDHVVALSSQTFFLLALKDDGTVWAWGDNDDGQLGNPDFAKKNHSDHFVQVMGLGHVKAISSYSSRTCYALLDDGTVWAWGNAQFGMSGNGAPIAGAFINARQFKPAQVQGISNAISIAGAMALLKDGTVWTWGEGMHGRLGNGSTAHTSTPVQVKGIHDVVAISARYEGAMALLRDGTVWAWGRNFKGQIGPNAHVEKYDRDKNFDAEPVQVTGVSNAIAIDADAVCLALMKDGTVKAWGWGAIGGMGRGKTESGDVNSVPMTVPKVANVVAIKAGNGWGFALLKDGTIMGWGSGMVKTGDYHQTWTPVVVGNRK